MTGSSENTLERGGSRCKHVLTYILKCISEELIQKFETVRDPQPHKWLERRTKKALFMDFKEYRKITIGLGKGTVVFLNSWFPTMSSAPMTLWLHKR